MSDNYFYLDNETILDKARSGGLEELYTIGLVKNGWKTTQGKITFFVIDYYRKGEDKNPDLLAIFRSRYEAEQINVKEFVSEYEYDAIRKYVLPQVTHDELFVLIYEHDNRYNDAERMAKISTIEDARAYIKEEQVLLEQLQAIMSEGWQDRILSEVKSSLEQTENVQDVQAMLDDYTAQWYKYHPMVVPSFWDNWGEPYCDFLAKTLLPMIREKISSIKQTQAISDAGAEGEKRTAYALKWLSAAGYREIAKDCSNKFGSGRLILENAAFIDEPQEFDHIVLGHNGVFCIETKNYSGELRIDVDGDWSRVNDDKATGMRNPVFQCDRHHALLQSILGNQVPIIDVICIANDQAIICGRENCPVAIVKYDQLSRYIQNHKSPAELSEQEVEKIAAKIELHKKR